MTNGNGNIHPETGLEGDTRFELGIITAELSSAISFAEIALNRARNLFGMESQTALTLATVVSNLWALREKWDYDVDAALRDDATEPPIMYNPN